MNNFGLVEVYRKAICVAPATDVSLTLCYAYQTQGPLTPPLQLLYQKSLR